VYEGRDVAVMDIPNAFIQTRVEDEKDHMAIIKIRGVLVVILVEIAPDVYKKYATKDKKGVRQLLVQCQKALYGTMVASLAIIVLVLSQVHQELDANRVRDQPMIRVS
jgi:hypothetical protein